MGCKKLWAIVVGILLYGAEVTYITALIAIFPLAARKRDISEFWIGVIIASVYYSSFAFSLIWPLIIRPHHLNNAYKCASISLGITFILFSFNFFIENKILFITLCIAERLWSGTSVSLLYITAIPVLTQIYPEKSGMIISAMQGFIFVAASIGPAVANLLYNIGGHYLPLLSLGILQILLAFLAMVLTPSYCPDQIDTKKPNKISRLDFYKLISKPSVILLTFPELIISLISGMNCATLSIYIKDSFMLDESNNYIIYVSYGLAFTLVAPLVGFVVDKGYATCIMVKSIITFPIVLLVFIYCKSLVVFIIAYCWQAVTSGIISNVSILYFVKQAEKWELSNTKMLAATLFAAIRASFRGVGATLFGGIFQELFLIQTTWWLAFLIATAASLITLFEMFKQGYYRKIFYEKD